MGSLPYDLSKIRQDFPILSSVVNEKPLVYLDNAASAQKPQAVLDRLTHFYTQEYANVHRGLYHLAHIATSAYEEARAIVQRFLNAPNSEEIIFTRSTTEAINLVASSFGQEHIAQGDEILLSTLEHHANIVPWHFLRERKGAMLKWIPLEADGHLSLEAIEQAFTKRTKILALSHMSNVLGHMLPIREIIAKAHAHDIPVLIDGSQAVVHSLVDVQDVGCDFYTFTGHKLYGPTGIGVLYAKRPWLERLPPFLGGGEMIEDVSQDHVTYQVPPYRFEAGTPPIAQAVGLGAAITYLEQIGRAAIFAHEQDLISYAMEQFQALPFVKIYGAPRPGEEKGKGPILAFDLPGIHPHDVATLLDQMGIAIRAGTHCAMPLCTHFRATALCRASFGLYNTRAEVDALTQALLKVHQLFSGIRR